MRAHRAARSRGDDAAPALLRARAAAVDYVSPASVALLLPAREIFRVAHDLRAVSPLAGETRVTDGEAEISRLGDFAVDGVPDERALARRRAEGLTDRARTADEL